MLNAKKTLQQNVSDLQTSETVGNPKNVLITADKEFDAYFTWKECLMCENQMPDNELLELIKAFMWIYEEEAEEQKLNAKKNSTNPEGKLWWSH